MRSLFLLFVFFWAACASAPPRPSLPEGLSREGVYCLPDAPKDDGRVVECYEGVDAIV
jgi:hypothetical protein